MKNKIVQALENSTSMLDFLEDSEENSEGMITSQIQENKDALNISNISLIAFSSELLETLKAVRSLVNFEFAQQGLELSNKIDQAISKAEGK